MYLDLVRELTHQDSKRHEDADDDSCERCDLVLVLPCVHIHVSLEPVEAVDVVVQPLVLPQLIHEARVRVDEPPPLPHIHERLLECQFVLLHDIRDDNRGGPGYSEMAMDEHVSLLQALVDKGVGHWEVGQEMGLRSVIGPNEERANIGISESGFREPMRLNGENMGDVKSTQHFGVCRRACIAEV